MKDTTNIGAARALHAFTRVESAARALRFRLAEVHGLAELLQLQTGELMKTEAELETEIATAKQTVVDALAAKDSAIAAQKTTIDSLTTLNDQLKAEVAAGNGIDSDKLFADVQGIIDAATPTAPAVSGTTGS